MDETRKQILEDLEPLFKKANEQKLWFRSNYQGVTFSPRELREQHIKGKFVWGYPNWELFDPSVLLLDIDKEVEMLHEKNIALHNRIAKGFE